MFLFDGDLAVNEELMRRKGLSEVPHTAFVWPAWLSVPQQIIILWYWKRKGVSHQCWMSTLPMVVASTRAIALRKRLDGTMPPKVVLSLNFRYSTSATSDIWLYHHDFCANLAMCKESNQGELGSAIVTPLVCI